MKQRYRNILQNLRDGRTRYINNLKLQQITQDHSYGFFEKSNDCLTEEFATVIDQVDELIFPELTPINLESPEADIVSECYLFVSTFLIC